MKPDPVAEDFAAWYSLYPRKKARKKALEVWRRLDKKGELAPMAELLLALSWQIKSDQWKRGFIPHPTTYLNQARWEDEPDDPSIGLPTCWARGARA